MSRWMSSLLDELQVARLRRCPRSPDRQSAAQRRCGWRWRRSCSRCDPVASLLRLDSFGRPSPLPRSRRPGSRRFLLLPAPLSPAVLPPSGGLLARGGQAAFSGPCPSIVAARRSSWAQRTAVAPGASESVVVDQAANRAPARAAPAQRVPAFALGAGTPRGWAAGASLLLGTPR